jgi:hypothetical protein
MALGVWGPLVERGDFVRYLSGNMSRGDLNLALWFYITDPKSVYEVWFEEYGREGPIAERRDRMVESFVVMLAGLRCSMKPSIWRAK